MQFEEILNNEMSVVVGIVTAILGISYPLLLQVIERIDTKYNSRAIISLTMQILAIQMVCGVALPRCYASICIGNHIRVCRT